MNPDKYIFKCYVLSPGERHQSDKTNSDLPGVK